MKKLDQQIVEVESRIARRRMSVELTGRALWHRSVARVLSPAGLLSAAALGFMTVAAVLRRRPKIVERRKSGRAPAKWGSVVGLVASGALTLLKARYGGTVGMANKVVEQMRAFKARKSQPSARPQARTTQSRQSAVVH